MDITTAIAKQLEGGRFAPEIDGDGAVFTGLAGSVAHGHPSGIRSRKQRRYNGGNALKSQGHHEGLSSNSNFGLAVDSRLRMEVDCA